MGLLNNVIKTVVISALGAKLARGRSPIVAALLTLLATRMMTKNDEPMTTQPQPQDGLGGLVEKFGKGGFEDIIRSWIGTGANKPIAPSQLSQALGPETVDNLSRESGMPRDDLLAQLSKLLPDVVDGLTPKGQLPPATDLLPGPMDEGEEPGPVQGQRAGARIALCLHPAFHAFWNAVQAYPNRGLCRGILLLIDSVQVFAQLAEDLESARIGTERAHVPAFLPT